MAYEWVLHAKKAGQFRGPVYGPILLEVECGNQQHAIYLEQQCPSKGLCAFTHSKVHAVKHCNNLRGIIHKHALHFLVVLLVFALLTSPEYFRMQAYC